MFAPKPAISGFGHAAMMRPVVVNKELVDEAKAENVVSIKTKKPRIGKKATKAKH